MKRSIGIGILFALTLLVLGAAGQRTHAQSDPAAGAACLQGPITQLASSGIQGNAVLCTDGAGVHVDMATTNLTPGTAYTIWFVYYDRPAGCQGNPCVDADVLGDNPPGTFGRMDGVVADATGMASFSGNFRGLHLSSGSQVWLLMFGHGPASTGDNRELARQLLTPQLPALGAPGLGAPADGAVGAGVAQARFTLP